MGKKGKREYVQVLRLLESFSLDDVGAAISEALERGVIGFDAVKHLVFCRIERRPPRLNLMAYPYLPRAEVATTSASTYMREETPDLIITDIMMDGGDGIETLLAARNVAARVPVIVMSGNELFLEQSKRLGAAAALLKPFRGAALLKSVEAVLAGSPAGATSVLI